MGYMYFETVLNASVSKYIVTLNIFLLLSKILWSRINNCYSILFSDLKQKEHCIIINRVINSHRGLMYWDTQYSRLESLISKSE